jgi:hypothetical protein
MNRHHNVGDEDWVMLYDLIDDGMFKEICLRLKQNDLDRGILDERNVYVDDTKLALLERSLDGNTRLYQLFIKIESQMTSPLTRAGLEAFAVGVSHSSIKSLKLTNFELSKTLQQVLFLGLRQSLSLKLLTLESSNLSMECLAYLLLPANELPITAGSRACGETRIKGLIIKDCNISAALSDVQRFARSLRNGVSVRKLSMHMNGMSDDMLIEFSKHWNLDSPVEDLSLLANEISFAGVHYLLERSFVCSALKSLCLSDMRIGYVGLKAIGGMLGRVQLEDLSLISCISIEDVTWVMEDPSRGSDICNEAFRELATGLRQNVTLQRFALTHSFVNANEAQILLQATIGHPFLKNIILWNNIDLGARGIQRSR